MIVKMFASQSLDSKQNVVSFPRPVVYVYLLNLVCM